MSVQLKQPVRNHVFYEVTRSLCHVHGFMDEHTFDVKRLMKCCIHQLLPDGRAVPFCAYNVLGYREQVSAGMRDGD